jgi:hypothetical protein
MCFLCGFYAVLPPSFTPVKILWYEKEKLMRLVKVKLSRKKKIFSVFSREF